MVNVVEIVQLLSEGFACYSDSPYSPLLSRVSTFFYLLELAILSDYLAN